MKIIEMKNVHKYYDNNLHVLKGISLSINEKESVVIMGASGSGKSTLIRCINFLERINEGSIKVDGETLTPQTNPNSTNILKLRERIGIVFQSFNLFPNLTALGNASIGLKVVKKMDARQAEEIAANSLEQVGLKDKIFSYPDQLSGGQQQRVAIARSLAMSPKVMLLDEITSALDPELIKGILELLVKVNNLGITTIIVTHEISFAEKSSDRICFLHDGKILEEGNPKEIIENPRSLEAKNFFRALH